MSLTLWITALPVWAIAIVFIVALILIIKGGDVFVDAAGNIAAALKIPPLIVGATIVSLATTLPEVIVSVSAVAKGNVDIAAGNAIGSVTANTALVMGVLLIGMPIMVDKKDFTPKGILLFLAAGVLILSCVFTPRFQMSDGVNEGEYYSLAGIGIVVLAILCITFFAQNIRHAKSDIKLAHTKEETAAAQPAFTKKQIVKSIIFFILGGAGIVIGAQALVESGSELALRFGIEQRVISVVAFALGTSLPELITAISALRKKESAISIGNIIGANIIDLTLILPLCAFSSVLKGNGSLAVPVQSVAIDMGVCLLTIAIAVIPTIFRGKFSRVQGGIMLTCYSAYVVSTVAF
ncbi:MAG: calcium/sodium antiporter [Clostridia bacterium]|nr:calcium/sodium antiporter [Clostridia bacterium]